MIGLLTVSESIQTDHLLNIKLLFDIINEIRLLLDYY